VEPRGWGCLAGGADTVTVRERGDAALSNPNGELRTSHARTPHHRLGGTITPNGLHFSINHGGIPNIDPAEHKLVIHGMVR
jgi:hypothetical protein